MAAVQVGFQENVRATNDLGKVAKAATILAISVTFLASMSISRLQDPTVAYSLFLIAGVVSVSLHPAFKSIRENPALRITAMVRPLAQSLGIGLAMMFIFVLAFRWTNRGAATVGEQASNLFLFAVVGAYVEETIRWLWLQTLPYALLTANGLWVLLHPQVGRMFAGVAPDLLFALFALEFGLLMTAVMWLYETPMSWGINLGLGPIAAATFHGIYNALVLSFSVVVGGVEFGTFALSIPMAGMVALTALACVVIYRRRHTGGMRMRLTTGVRHASAQTA